MARSSLQALWRRVRWFASGEAAVPVPAFDWISGRVGSRQNPDGMRSVILASVALAAAIALLDLLCLARHDWAQWQLLCFLHLAWVSGFMVATALNVGFLETPEGVVQRRLGGPNVLTLARAVSVPLLVYLIARRDPALAFAGYAVATATDVVDGWWARHGGGTTKLGIVLDPVVDLLLHLAVLGTLSLTGLLGGAVLVLIVARSALLVFGTLVLYLWKGCVRIQPTPWGKGTGLFLTIATLALLALSAWRPDAAWAFTLLRRFFDVVLVLAFLHVVAIGIVNLGRPPIARGEDA
jgi:cardiolipin synthase